MRPSVTGAYKCTRRHLPLCLFTAILLLTTVAYGDEKFESHYDTGQIKETGFINEKGERVGEWITYYRNGQENAIVPWVDGKVHGELKMYFQSGQLRGKELWEHGKKVGESIAYWPNGQVKWKAQFQDGNQQGEVVHYDEEGNVTKRQTFEKGKLILSTD